jgi:hypothetical protein
MVQRRREPSSFSGLLVDPHALNFFAALVFSPASCHELADPLLRLVLPTRTSSSPSSMGMRLGTTNNAGPQPGGRCCTNAVVCAQRHSPRTRCLNDKPKDRNLISGV